MNRFFFWIKFTFKLKYMIWEGRMDGEDPLEHRIFQRVKIQNNCENISRKDVVVQGFAVDEGVQRNKGKAGAKDAPDIIRKNMGNFPVTKIDFSLLDVGNVLCENGDLQSSQNQLAQNVSVVLSSGAKSLVLGGGHELMFGHYCGIREAFPGKKIGIINVDAHFDNREVDPEIGETSGTGFSQIAQVENLHTLHIGIQPNSNTLKLFDFAHRHNMKYILADELFFENLPQIYEKINTLSDEVDVLYLTICMDVFNASIAPGVSATAYNGVFADATFMHFYRHILSNEKLLALDFAEVNPAFDQNEQTARLAAGLANEWFMVESK